MPYLHCGWQRSRQAFSDIDVQLKQRHDLIPNLVETVKGYATHERGTLEAVIKARNAAVSAQGPAAQAAAEGALQSALRQIMVLAEAYPDLKANQNFPAVLIAGPLGFREHAFFDLGEQRAALEQAPSVKF